MPRSRTTKWLAKRINPRYVFRRNSLLIWRAAAVVACVVLAFLWCAAVGPLGHTRVFSPGRVSAAHAMWNDDCARCHTGARDQRSEEGHHRDRWIDQTVSDDACLKCHDGAVHHHDQNDGKLISDDRKHAAHCAECHTEHQGRTMLATVADNQCVACHQNITAAIRDGASVVIQNHVTAFTIADHPPFGRTMAPGGQPLLSTTLKFNHQLHLKKDGIQQDCTVCHSAANPDSRSHSEARELPPWCDPTDRPSNWTDDSPRRYFRQISYQRDCIGCHQLDLLDHTKFPGLFVAPHLSLVALRDQRAKLSQPPNAKRLEKWIDELAPADRDKFLEEKVFASSDHGHKKPLTKKLTKEEWIGKRNPEILSLLADVTADDDTFVRQLASDLNVSCSKCHELIDSGAHLKTVASDASSQPVAGDSTATQPANPTAVPDAGTVSAPADAATTQPLNLATAPTNLPSYARRWYPHSKFDHDAHRNMTCRECHKPSGDSAADSDVVLLPAIEICARCHVPQKPGILIAAADTAPAGCVTCHVFHDRNQETVRQGSFTMEQLLHPVRKVDSANPPRPPPASTQPVAAAKQHP